jgi:O-acetyl-ADP-ribose deacetylase (regulator of RNase III)
MSGKIIEIVGDVTEYIPQFEEEIVIIPHVCNNLGVMGSGVALALKNKWNIIEKEYKNICLNNKDYNKSILGKTDFVKVNDNLIIANMIAQNNLFNNHNNTRPLNYRALAICMENVYKYCKQYKNFAIHTPKFGSLRSGGNWDFILELIEDFWLKRDVNVVVYKFQE